MPDLGRFNVKMFTDGFVVKNVDAGDSLEIIGIGQSLVLVRGIEKQTTPDVPASRHGTPATVQDHANSRLLLEWRSSEETAQVGLPKSEL